MNNIRHLAHKLFDLIIDYFEEIISILTAALVLYYSQTRPQEISLTHLSNAILVIVALLAVSDLKDKYSLKKVERELSDLSGSLKRKVIDQIRAENLFSRRREPDKEFFLNSQEINISGITLVKSIGKYYEILTDRISDGGNARIILLATSKEAVKQLELRSWGLINSKGYYKTRIKSTYNQLKVIADNVSNNSKHHGSLVIGHLPFVPSFGIAMVDPKNISRGKAWIEIYHHKTDDAGPGFLLERARDERWFLFFKKQFEEMWEACDKEALLKTAR